MKLEEIVSWLDRTLNVAAFDDVSSNGLQLGRKPGIGERVQSVAFAVDASVRAVEAAARVGSQLLVVHHGIFWGGGVKRLTGGVYNVVKAAMDANLAVYASHLPLDAHPTLGNNAQLARLFGLKKVRPAFRYHGATIGLVGVLERPEALDVLVPPEQRDRLIRPSASLSLGLCSGAAGAFAEEAKQLGCDLYLTGEADWGDVVAAENCGMKMICAGHYATEVFGVRAVAKSMKRALKVRTVDLTEELK